MKSIIQDNKECFICRSPNVEDHHIFYGTGNRQLSEQYGLKVWLCYEHHRGNHGVHFNKALDDRLKATAEKRFYEVYPYDFKRLFYGDGIEVIHE